MAQTLTPIYVVWWPDNEPHAHMVLCSDGTVPLSVVFQHIEMLAGELADQVLACNPDKHNHHGATHSMQDALDAFKMAVNQLYSKDFEADWADLQRKIAAHKLWGGTVPAAVIAFHPEDPKKEQLMLTGGDGIPRYYEVGKKMLTDIMPRPDQDKRVVKHPSGLGWMRRRRRDEQKRLSRLARKNLS